MRPTYFHQYCISSSLSEIAPEMWRSGALKKAAAFCDALGIPNLQRSGYLGFSSQQILIPWSTATLYRFNDCLLVCSLGRARFYTSPVRAIKRIYEDSFRQEIALRHTADVLIKLDERAQSSECRIQLPAPVEIGL